MSAAYTPRKGTVAHRLIEHLEAAAPGTMLTLDEIAVTFGVNSESVVTVLRATASAGLLDFTKVVRDGKPVRAYHLPVVDTDEAPETLGPLAINHDSTGDLWFTGGRQTAEGGTLLSKRQLMQLVSYATTKPVDLHVADAEAQS